MDNKDFFDKEYDKVENARQEQQRGQVDGWYAQSPQKASNSGNKPLYIVLICLALVLCFALGWVICTVFNGGFQSTEQRLLNDVFKVLDNDYYKEVEDAKMWAGVEEAGTALLQTAGDRFSRLMSPATYYNYEHPVSSVGSGTKGVFGMSFQVVEGLGLYVSSVTANSSSYGVLESGDMIVKISNINGNKGVQVDGETFTDITVSDYGTEFIQQMLVGIDSADFGVLRDGTIITKFLQRTVIDYPNSKYPFEFVEFYFDDSHTNVTVNKGAGMSTTTKEMRLLNRLSSIPSTGYIRIDQFMETETKNGMTDAYTEFKEAMDLFKELGLKRLVLDLKGNPGGSVLTVCKIGGMLATDAALNSYQQQAVRNSNGELLMTTINTRSMGSEGFYTASSYEQYFGQISDKPVIVIWTDGGSASASELLTGALTDYGTAVQMGVTTYGKGIAQTIKKLDYKGTFYLNGEKITENWYVYYTFAEYCSPVKNQNIHGKGYTPTAQYDNLDTYEKLWDATEKYFKSASLGGGILAAA